jgi:hypothetical protein
VVNVDPGSDRLCCAVKGGTLNVRPHRRRLVPSSCGIKVTVCTGVLLRQLNVQHGGSVGWLPLIICACRIQWTSAAVIDDPSKQNVTTLLNQMYIRTRRHAGSCVPGAPSPGRYLPSMLSVVALAWFTLIFAPQHTHSHAMWRASCGTCGEPAVARVVSQLWHMW